MPDAFGTSSDPSDFTVADVIAYLEQVADPGEVQRVLSQEQSGKQRTGVLAFTGTQDEAPSGDPVNTGGTSPHEDAEAMGYDVKDVTEAANFPAVTEVDETGAEKDVPAGYPEGYAPASELAEDDTVR